MAIVMTTKDDKEDVSTNARDAAAKLSLRWRARSESSPREILTLEECMGDRGIVGRLGGDEFAVLLPMLVDLADAHTAASELVKAFTDPLKVHEYEILVGVSAGRVLALTLLLTLPPC